MSGRGYKKIERMRAEGKRMRRGVGEGRRWGGQLTDYASVRSKGTIIQPQILEIEPLPSCRDVLQHALRSCRRHAPLLHVPELAAFADAEVKGDLVVPGGGRPLVYGVTAPGGGRAVRSSEVAGGERPVNIGGQICGAGPLRKIYGKASGAGRAGRLRRGLLH